MSIDGNAAPRNFFHTLTNKQTFAKQDCDLNYKTENY